MNLHLEFTEGVQALIDKHDAPLERVRRWLDDWTADRKRLVPSERQASGERVWITTIEEGAARLALEALGAGPLRPGAQTPLEQPCEGCLFAGRTPAPVVELKHRAPGAAVCLHETFNAPPPRRSHVRAIGGSCGPAARLYTPNRLGRPPQDATRLDRPGQRERNKR